MPDDRKRRPHNPSERAIARWINEGGAPKGVDRSMHPNRRSAVAKKAAITRWKKKQPYR